MITFLLIIIGLVLGGIAALITRGMSASRNQAAERSRSTYRGSGYGYSGSTSFTPIGWVGFLIGAVAVIFVAFISAFVGVKVAKGNLLSYNEFWNGYETQAIWDKVPCDRDGRCRHTYQCDPYTVTVTKTRQVGSGKNARTETYTDTETHYHDCPDVTEEWSFAIKNSLGKTVSVADNIFPDHPQAWRGDRYDRAVPQGVPKFWAEGKARLDSKDPRPVTEVHNYDNYILASQNSILKSFSGAVDQYKNSKLLPTIAAAQDKAGITAPYVGNKAYFVKDIPNKDAWRDAVNRFDSAFGTELQGDMHVVFVDSTVDKDQYKGALNAYWTDPAVFEKNSLSKNGFVVIVGTDGTNVSWVKAFTGMPIGNEGLIVGLENIKNVPLDPASFLGTPKGIVNPDGKVKQVAHSEGLVEKAVWGTDRFKRACMKCEGEGDSGTGFTYLDGEIEPTSSQVTLIILSASVLMMLLWAGIGALQIPDPNLKSN